MNCPLCNKTLLIEKSAHIIYYTCKTKEKFTKKTHYIKEIYGNFTSDHEEFNIDNYLIKSYEQYSLIYDLTSGKKIIDLDFKIMPNDVSLNKIKTWIIYS